MNADIHTLYESDFYRITDFRCRCTECIKSKPEYSKSFCISFVRKGNFLFNVFRHSLDAYNGCILVTKPGYERTVTHTHTIPDECTIFDFKQSFYNTLLDQYGHLPFFRDQDLHSTLVKTNAETEFLHYYIVKLLLSNQAVKLEIDNLVMSVVAKTLNNITDYTPDEKINASLKKNHLVTIERAKQYITENYSSDISLNDLAAHCYVSPFHFSRIFKLFTSYSPHRFLLATRLHHAELLVKSTVMPVADIAFSCGFNSIEHFTAAFRQQYQSPPISYRSHYTLA